MADLPLLIEPETPADFASIERLNERVFGPGRFARTAYRLREEAEPDLTLSFVARVGTLLVGANLRGMSFRKTQLKQLDFSDADLSGCDFREAIFVGGSLRNAHLKLTRFDGADLREADIGGLTLVDVKLFRGATISHKQAAEMLGELGLSVA